MTEIKMSPLILIGLFIFVAPIILENFGVTAWPVVRQVGLGTLIIGIVHTAYMRMKQ